MNQQQDNMVTTANSRLGSLDALRGFDMFWIICGEGIFHGLANAVMKAHSLVRNPINWRIGVEGELSFFERMTVGISNQLHHSPWNGFTFYDLIFPLFIFIAGISMPFSFSKQLQKKGIDKSIAKRTIYRSLIKRTIILILLGMVVNGVLKFQGYENTRFASVLGRIALSCFFAAIIYLNCSFKKQIGWFLFLLIGYWTALMLVPVPGFGAGVLTEEGNLSAYIDRLLLPGKLHRVVYDPEGLLSTIPAIASALLGVFTGQFLQLSVEKWTPIKKTITIFLTGIVLLTIGVLWGLVFPINKNMWTSSFVLLAGGWSMILFALFYFIIDVAGYKKWSKPFVWIGMNAILIYIAAYGLVDFEATAHFLFDGIINRIDICWQEALLWVGVLVIQLALLYFLYRQKWFLKI